MTKQRWKRTLTPEEQAFIQKKIADRICNLVYEKAGEDSERAFMDLGGKEAMKHITAEDDIDILITVTFLGNDLIEILGEYDRSRQKGGKKHE